MTGPELNDWIDYTAALFPSWRRSFDGLGDPEWDATVQTWLDVHFRQVSLEDAKEAARRYAHLDPEHRARSHDEVLHRIAQMARRVRADRVACEQPEGGGCHLCSNRGDVLVYAAETAAGEKRNGRARKKWEAKDPESRGELRLPVTVQHTAVVLCGCNLGMERGEMLRSEAASAQRRRNTDPESYTAGAHVKVHDVPWRRWGMTEDAWRAMGEQSAQVAAAAPEKPRLAVIAAAAERMRFTEASPEARAAAARRRAAMLRQLDAETKRVPTGKESWDVLDAV